MDRNRTAALLCLIAAGCMSRNEPPPGLGKRVFEGPVRALTAAPDGSWLAFLDGCRDVKAQVLPPQTASCDLRVAPAAGGDARRIARAVTTLPHGVGWSADGALAALADYEYPTASGTLVLWRASGGEARPLGSGVTFHGFGARGELGFVAGGKLSVLLPGESAPRQVEGADSIASFELSPAAFPPCGYRDGLLVRLVARRTYPAGGQLLASDCALREAHAVERGHVGEYGFAPAASPHLAYTVQGKDGAELKLVQTAESVASWTVGRGARSFAFAPSGRSVAFVADVVPGKQGNLHLASPGGKDALVSREVGELLWAKGADRLAWLEAYDPRVRSGTLGAGGPGLAPRTFAQNVSDFELSPDGKHLAFLQHTTRGGYSVDLGLAHLDAAAGEKPTIVAQGAFGFAFSPDGSWLYYRTRCVRNAEACDLERIPAAGPAPGGKPEAVAQGVKSFEFDPRDPARLLVTWQRLDSVSLDIGVWKDGKLVSVDTAVLPGSARFLGPDSRRLAYVVSNPKRQGVYVAELPR